MKSIEAWHFLASDKRFGYGDGNLAAPGYVYSVDGPIALCSWGLHFSVRALDAVEYAPGSWVGRVIASGDIILGDDKGVATHRQYLWIADATETLRAFARWSALQVINMWDAPDIVRRYLESGDESLRTAAWDAARAAARAAAWAAAWDAARAAAWAAARGAAWDAAWAAARAAARAAAWDAARGAARGAARAAARDAARDAARGAAWDAAWDAARAAARAAQNDELHNRLMALAPKK